MSPLSRREEEDSIPTPITLYFLFHGRIRDVIRGPFTLAGDKRVFACSVNEKVSRLVLKAAVFDYRLVGRISTCYMHVHVSASVLTSHRKLQSDSLGVSTLDEISRLPLP